MNNENKNIPEKEKVESKFLISTETWLPLFPGFYETIYNSDYQLENFLYNENEEIPPEYNLTSDDYNFDFKKWSNDISKEFVDNFNIKVKEILKEFFDDYEDSDHLHNIFGKVEFQAISSPAYYNFENNTINVKFYFNQEHIDNINELLYSDEPIADFEQYLKDNYTTCDGFSSSYSNTIDSDDWRDINNCIKHEHKCAVLINAIINNLISYSDILDDEEIDQNIQFEDYMEKIVDSE